MRQKRLPRQSVLSLKVTKPFRRLVEQLSARLTTKNGERWTLTDVLEEAIRVLAEREGLKT